MAAGSRGGLGDTRPLFRIDTTQTLRWFTLVTAGKMNKQIAGDLNLSEITVKIHRGSVMRKMGARTLADLVKMAELLRMAGSGSNDHR